MEFAISANLVDVVVEKVFPATLKVLNGRIQAIVPLEQTTDTNDLPYIIPGFVDAHVHIESSMLVPSEFARMAVIHGTVATVSDPHEIANVCGIAGVEFMIENGRQVPFKFHFGAPSCVPATSFETAGATVDVDAVSQLLQRDEIWYLSEVMNYPGVLHGDPDMLGKIAAAQQAGKPVDGHAPGLRGEAARQYAAAGITTDHECFTADEALDKLRAGMHSIIREGSAARNFDALIGLLSQWPDKIMFCSDDKHPDSLLEGHINKLCARAVALGIPLFHVLQAACLNPVRHYRLPVGLLQPGDPADFAVLSDLQSFTVMATYINGELVAEGGRTHIAPVPVQHHLNVFHALPLDPLLLAMPWSSGTMPVIVAEDGQLVTGKIWVEPEQDAHGMISSSVANDILKLVVYNRYSPAAPAVAFIKNFGLKKGAIASTVAHDSHNIIAVGVSDNALAATINALVANKGGLSATDGEITKTIALPIAGLMTDADGFSVAAEYTAIDRFAKEQLGATLSSPFMTLSFMALLVIPHLKLSDLGLFDGDSFALVNQGHQGA